MDCVIPYPGSKRLLQHIIIRKLLTEFPNLPFREPFLGGGWIGFEMLQCRAETTWLNDIDSGMWALWKCIRSYPDEFNEIVSMFEPSKESYPLTKEFLLSSPPIKTKEDILMLGFAKLVCHRLSYSGIGIRGSQRHSDWEVHWIPRTTIREVDRLHRIFKEWKPRITNLDYKVLIEDESRQCVLYLDPPYFENGSRCYYHSFSNQQHRELARLLEKTNHHFLLSYDNHPAITRLYRDWCDIEIVDARYSLQKSTNAEEIFITRK